MGHFSDGLVSGSMEFEQYHIVNLVLYRTQQTQLYITQSPKSSYTPPDLATKPT